MTDGLLLTKDDHLKWFEIVAFTDKIGFPGWNPANVSPPFKAQYFRGGEVESSYPFFFTSDTAGRKNQSWTAGYEAYAIKRVETPEMIYLIDGTTPLEQFK